MRVANDHRNPLTTPESAVLNLVEAILTFTPILGYGKADVVAKAFARQSTSTKTAIRKHWICDHLPFYAAFIDLDYSEFEQDLAEKFWRELEKAATSNYKPRARQQEVQAI